MRTAWIQACVVLGAGAWLALAIAGCSFTPGVASGVSEADGGQPNSYPCSCTCKVKSGTHTIAVQRSSDDAEENTTADSTVNLTDPQLHLTQSTVRVFVGLRFSGLPIPAGVHVQSAYIQFTAAQSTSGSTNFEWDGEAINDAPTFTTGNSNLSTRPITSNIVSWAPVAWVAGDSGSAEQTTDLSPILNEIVSRPGWKVGNAAVFGLRGTGNRVAYSFDGDPSKAPRLVVTYTVPGSDVTANLQVCMPDDQNPALNGGVATDLSKLGPDCQVRVQTTLSDLNNACNYPSDCACELPSTFTTSYSQSCDHSCAANPLDTTACSNYDPSNALNTATNTGSDSPVCVSHSPITAELFGQRSLCDVSGTASFTSDDESKTTSTSGQMEFSGTPCPGGSCAVGVSYALVAAPITFDSLFGSATFRNLVGLGESLPGHSATLATDGTGSFGSDSTASSARGTRGSDALAFNGSNGDPVNVAVDWSGKSCSFAGTVVGSVDPELKRCENAGPTANQVCTQDSDCTDDPGCTDGVCNCLTVGTSGVTLGLNVTGTLANQPPSIEAGADQLVECNAAGAGLFNLSATPSDPDGNTRGVTWLRGGRTGDVLGYLATIPVSQPVGATQLYTAQVLDGLAQAAEDTTHVQVVDTTPPVISCNAPASVGPNTLPRTFRATASDVCDPAATPQITGFTCFVLNGKGQVVDKTHSCGITFSGNAITVTQNNGIGEHIRWTVQVSDTSGNHSNTTCETLVGKQ